MNSITKYLKQSQPIHMVFNNKLQNSLGPQCRNRNLAHIAAAIHITTSLSYRGRNSILWASDGMIDIQAQTRYELHKNKPVHAQYIKRRCC